MGPVGCHFRNQVWKARANAARVSNGESLRKQKEVPALRRGRTKNLASVQSERVRDGCFAGWKTGDVQLALVVKSQQTASGSTSVSVSGRE
jgi:hypothetical protein